MKASHVPLKTFEAILGTDSSGLCNTISAASGLFTSLPLPLAMSVRTCFIRSAPPSWLNPGVTASVRSFIPLWAIWYPYGLSSTQAFLSCECSSHCLVTTHFSESTADTVLMVLASGVGMTMWVHESSKVSTPIFTTTPPRPSMIRVISFFSLASLNPERATWGGMRMRFADPSLGRSSRARRVASGEAAAAGGTLCGSGRGRVGAASPLSCDALCCCSSWFCRCTASRSRVSSATAASASRASLHWSLNLSLRSAYSCFSAPRSTSIALIRRSATACISFSFPASRFDASAASSAAASLPCSSSSALRRFVAIRCTSCSALLAFSRSSSTSCSSLAAASSIFAALRRSCCAAASSASARFAHSSAASILLSISDILDSSWSAKATFSFSSSIA
eukprot:Sspe_Gene.45426::Locus_22489_Transcript_1_3_Confidence_0.286_Length_1391::g.45426::m.45426